MKLKDARYIDLPIGTKFKPSMKHDWIVKPTVELQFFDSGRHLTFYTHSVVLVEDKEC